MCDTSRAFKMASRGVALKLFLFYFFLSLILFSTRFLSSFMRNILGRFQVIPRENRYIITSEDRNFLNMLLHFLARFDRLIKKTPHRSYREERLDRHVCDVPVYFPFRSALLRISSISLYIKVVCFFSLVALFSFAICPIAVDVDARAGNLGQPLEKKKKQ